jgi:hypothetical protein
MERSIIIAFCKSGPDNWQYLILQVCRRPAGQGMFQPGFPEDFMFRLTADEWSSISSSQFVMMDNIPKNRTGKYLPYAFTEHGVTMLASVTVFTVLLPQPR